MAKLLGEYLQEQQEPFALEVYLLERGYSKRISLLNASAKCRGLKMRRRYVNVKKCSRLFKAVVSRLVYFDTKFKINSGSQKCSLANNNRESRGEEQHDEDGLSSAGSTNVSNSCSSQSNSEEDIRCCSEADAEHTSEENNHFFSAKEADADRRSKRRSVEDDNTQLSPVSVLEDTETESDDDDDGSPVQHNQQYNLKTTNGGTSTSASECKAKQQATPHDDAAQELLGSDDSHAQYMTNKTALQQSKQLLIDCVREVIENHRKIDKTTQQLGKILGPDELWKVVCENVWLWSQDPIDETNVHHLLHRDFRASAQEWNADYEQHEGLIAMEIGDDILEDIIDDIFTI